MEVYWITKISRCNPWWSLRLTTWFYFIAKYQLVALHKFKPKYEQRPFILRVRNFIENASMYWKIFLLIFNLYILVPLWKSVASSVISIECTWAVKREKESKKHFFVTFKFFLWPSNCNKKVLEIVCKIMTTNLWGLSLEVSNQISAVCSV